jgi:sortase A
MSEIPLTSLKRVRTAPPGMTPPQAPSPGHPSRRASRASRWLAFLLIGAGALVLLDAGATLLWQEPLTALYAKIRQDHLSGALHTIEHAAPTPVERRALASLPDERRRIAFLAHELERHAGSGSAVGRIVIPRINASYVIVKGTGTEELKGGPGIYPQTTFPGIAGTTAIAGHRTTYLAPFRHVDSLRNGNRILINMPYAHFTYTVIGHEVVPPSDFRAAVDRLGYSRLVLSACTPLFSAAKRILVFAHLTRTVPVGAARRLPHGVKALPIETPGRAELERRRARRPAPSPAVLESLEPHVVSAIVQ